MHQLWKHAGVKGNENMPNILKERKYFFSKCLEKIMVRYKVYEVKEINLTGKLKKNLLCLRY